MNAAVKLTPAILATVSLEPKPLSKPTVLVLGGYGFIGRHIVDQLKRLGAQVLIGTRRKKSMLSPANQRTIALHRLSHQPEWREQLKHVDVVINAVGILRQRWGETYEQVHHQAVAELAQVCKQHSTRLVHISALGLNNAVTSRFLRSKLLGEHALAKSGADWHLVRPSLVDGEGGYGAKWFRRLAKWPVHFIPSNARGLIAPIAAVDLAKAVAVIALQKNRQQTEQKTSKRTNALISAASRIYELGGARNMSLRDYLLGLAATSNAMEQRPVACIKIPALLARIVSHVCDVLHLTPFSFGHYELLKRNNLPSNNRLQELLVKWGDYDRRQAALKRAAELIN